MLNLNKVGRPLAKIEGGKYSGHIVSVSDQFLNSNGKEEKDNLIKEFRQLKIANDSKFQHIPDTTKEREILYITGPSGSGKSTYTRKYLEQYKKKFKNRPIYLFSSLPSDESLDKVQPKRIKLDETIHTDPIKVEELRESICIFDDIDVISDKKIREGVYVILNQVLEIGRHYKIHCVVTNHLPTNGKDTRRILNEAHTVTYFPHSAGGKIKYLLEEYVGLDKRQISYMKKQRSRWATVYKNFPQCYMLEHEIGLLNIHDDSSEDEQLVKAKRRSNFKREQDGEGGGEKEILQHTI
jgi:energy-coupling factor transporter ATP-binding protein EcfA2